MIRAINLEKYKGKTVDEVIEIEKQLDKESFDSYQREEENKKELLNEVVKQKYYKINFNGQSFLYVDICKLNNLECNAINVIIKNNEISVKKETGVAITISLKSKKAILKKAMSIISEVEKPVDNLEQEIAEIVKTNEEIEIPEEVEKVQVEIVKEAFLSTMDRGQLITFAKNNFNETFSFFQGKETIRKKVITLAEKAGYKVL